MPLVGLEADHLKVSDVADAFRSENGGIRLFDTSHVAGNEHVVAQGIVDGVKLLKDTKNLQGPVEVHVVTKIWYTHLGYNRTKHSIQETFDAFSEALNDPGINLKIHAMLHWPRCYEGIEWMNCEHEESQLSDHVKRLGPAPHLDSDEAWKESWRALEDLYTSGKENLRLASVGIANFNHKDLVNLMRSARVAPQLVHMSTWSLLHDPYAVDLCNKHGAHIQVSDMMHSVVAPAVGKNLPNAGSHMQKVAYELSSGSSDSFSISQVVAKWLNQFGISVLQQEADFSIDEVPDLSEEHQFELGSAIEAVLSQNDLEDDAFVKVKFHAQDQDMVLFYFPGPEEEDEVMISYIRKGSFYEESTHPNHPFRVYSAVDPYTHFDYKVDATYGESQDVYVTLE
jgi:diketogulonate reductase-like aldo/keto reductase